jgi:hypothetical protein
MGRLPLMGTAGFQSWTVEIQMHGRSFFRPLVFRMTVFKVRRTAGIRRFYVEPHRNEHEPCDPV